MSDDEDNDDMITTSEGEWLPSTEGEEDMTEEESSLEREFNRQFDHLKKVYKLITNKVMPEPDSFQNDQTMTIRGRETEIHSSVPFEQLKDVSESNEGDWRGIYVVTSDNSIRYSLFINDGEKPKMWNFFSLRVVKPSDAAEREMWSEMRISTMPAGIASELFSRPPGARREKNPEKKRLGNRGMMMPQKVNLPSEPSETEEEVEG
jgi:hypothetical protein